jgi:phage terminase large subunit-like protein
MVLDTGEYWEPEDFQLYAAEDLFAGHREVWLVIPEGNGKTTLLSGFELYHADYTPSAEVVVGASSRDQCLILHNQAAGFVARTPGLGKRFRVFDGYRRITALRTGGRIQVYAADDRTGDGVIPTLALLEELHRQRDLRLYRTWLGKIGKRGGQLAAISTGGEPDSEFEVIRQRHRREAPDIRVDGCHVRAAGSGMVLHDYAVPEGADHEDLKLVKAANPLSTITVKSLAEKRSSPSMTISHWRRFNCNQAVRGTESAIDEREWADAGTDERIPVGQPIEVGFDAGWKWDCTAIVPLWVESHEKRLFGIPEIITPPRDGTTLHPQKVKDAFLRIYARNPIVRVVMDEDRAAEIAYWLAEELGCEVVAHSQTDAPMALAAERWNEALREGRLKHPRDPEFTRHVLNAVEKLLRNGQVKFERPSSSRDKAKQDQRVVDALDAGLMVHSVAITDLQNVVDPDAYRIELI